MRPFALTAAIVALYAMTNAASACVLRGSGYTTSEILAESNPVVVDRQCRTINIGVYDGRSLGRATDLGNGRVQQVLENTDRSHVLLADCNTREATILQGAVTEVEESSCGLAYSYAPITGDNAPMSLSVGSSLHELVYFAALHGMTEIDANDHFFRFRSGGGWQPVGRKDRFDLFCGCKLFYPDSPGAQK